MSKPIKTLLEISGNGIVGFDDIPEISISPGINILVGKNNVGKSRTLDFISSLKELGPINFEKLTLSANKDSLTYTIKVINLNKYRKGTIEFLIENEDGEGSHFGMSRVPDRSLNGYYYYSDLVSGVTITPPSNR